MLQLELLCFISCLAFCNCKAIKGVEDYTNGTVNSTTTLPIALTYEYTETPSSNGTSMESDGTDIRINGGRPADVIVPYQVSIQRFLLGRSEHVCGGSIITATHVVTAAHCLAHVPSRDMIVVVGTVFWRQGGDRHRVINMRWHPEFLWTPIIINDIAVLKVWPPFDFNKPTISIISLARQEFIGENIPVRVTGWGSIVPNSIQLPEQLQFLDYTTISNQECMRRGSRITVNELCALADRGLSTCYRDSGGPLVTLHGPPQLVGIVSYGSAVCAQGEPDIYTRVSSFLPFIDRAIHIEIP